MWRHQKRVPHLIITSYSSLGGVFLFDYNIIQQPGRSVPVWLLHHTAAWEECSCLIIASYSSLGGVFLFDYYIIQQPGRSVPCLIITSYDSQHRKSVPHLIMTSGRVFSIWLLHHTTAWEEWSLFDYYIIWQHRKTLPHLNMTSYDSVGRVFPIWLWHYMAGVEECSPYDYYII